MSALHASGGNFAEQPANLAGWLLSAANGPSPMGGIEAKLTPKVRHVDEWQEAPDVRPGDHGRLAVTTR